MSFRIQGFDPAPFAPLFSLSDDDLRTRGMKRVVAAAARAYPCRVSLVDAAIGAELILLSVRAYDASDEIVEAEVVDGTGARVLFERLLADPAVAYLHVHVARRGCFGCRVDRA